jgi:hypothetical protein
MKTAAIITIIALLLLPPVAGFIHIIMKLLKGDDTSILSAQIKSSPTKMEFHRKMGFSIYAIHFLLLFSALAWAFFLFLPDFNGKLYVLIFAFVFFCFLFFPAFFWWRYVNKRNPRPQPSSDTKSILEWENKYADLFSKYLVRILLITFSLYILVIGVLILVIFIFT